jgi:chorismate mutase/prephenate dehydratase
MSETGSSDSQPLADPRSEIDRLDQKLLLLLKERMAAVRDVGDVKRLDRRLPLHDPEREAEVARFWAQEAARQGLSDHFTARILREILNYSKRLQEPRRRTRCRIGYQGIRASYSDLAIGTLFATRGTEDLERVGLVSFSAVFDALEQGKVDYALVPVENTLIGSITEVNQLLVTRKVAVVDEEIWELEHCLVGLPGARIEELREIRSHRAALQQCRRLLGDLPGVRAVEFFDTAGAAQSVREANDPQVAALCSEEAAQLFALTVLEYGVGDRSHNQTRFLLLAREAEAFADRQPSKTSVTFAVDHRCGALAHCLSALADHGVNLTRLESRPQPDRPWEYCFLADLEGHGQADAIQAALQELRRRAHQVRVLGSYPARAARR